ncbi:hypothetical protein CAEBREN_22717 [Caenorhabditis brenneri]|uniref:Uncharacterized protein n=1 Tax=Caenorhabditis brenneri TaxID=135651 RepID=G0NXD3_CAEBE|nr:hypothetical protein CAEBREN_22717 [Caenorhabditis brenneri]
MTNQLFNAILRDADFTKNVNHATLIKTAKLKETELCNKCTENGVALLKMKELEKEFENLNGSLKDFDGQEERLKEKNEESSKDIGNLGEQVESEKLKTEEAYRRNNKIETMFDEAKIRLATKENSKLEEALGEWSSKGKEKKMEYRSSVAVKWKDWEERHM